MMKSSSVERDEFSVVAWRLTGIQHSGWGREDHSTSQEWTSNLYASPKCAYLVMKSGPGLEGAVMRSPTSPDYLPNFHGTFGHDGNADIPTGLGK